jgi:GEVED domain/Fibronectin type III domain/Secretion system C-terminal sorting domain
MKQLFTFIMMVLLSAAIHAQCGAPANLAAAYSNNVTVFTWDAVPGAVDYTIEIKQTSDDWVSAEVVQTVSANSFSVTGIFHSAAIDWRVLTNCGSGVSAYTVVHFSVPCPVPTGLTATNITAGGATLNWVPASGYNTFISNFVVSYRLANTTAAWTQVGHTSSSTINVSGLNPNTAYEWCVNQTCPYFNSSPAISSFTTALPTCGTPANVVFTYSSNVSTFTWDAVPGAVNYKVQMGWAGAPWGTSEQVATSNSFSISNLMQGGNFQFRVRANCGSSYSYYAPLLFSTPCIEPYSLSTTNISTTSATLNWQQSATINNNNTGFSVSYRQANTNNAWIQLTDIYNNPTATFYNLTGLTPGTAYEWRVRRVCSATNSSYISSQFVTLSCISNGVNANEWIDLFSLGSISRVSGAEAGGYANVQSATNLTIGSASNTGQISAGFSGNTRNQRYSIYIDFNRNGSFADAGELLVNAASMNNAGTFNFNVAIPPTATAGPTRMRVIMRRNPGAISPCITGYFGETEDYIVNLVTTASKTAAVAILSPSSETEAVITASPNPSGGLFTIQMPGTMQAVSYEVMNAAGILIQKNMIKRTGIFKTDISTVPPGIYLLRIRDEAGRQHLVKLQKN